jgi:hypothetical protein
LFVFIKKSIAFCRETFNFIDIFIKQLSHPAFSRGLREPLRSLQLNILYRKARKVKGRKGRE